MIARRAVVTGRVQGVFFRQHLLYATAPKAGSGYAYRWYVGGRVVARWAVTIGQGD